MGRGYARPVLALTAANLVRRAGRTALAALGVALGVTTVVALLALTGGIDRSAGDLAHLGRADLGVFQAGISDLTVSSLPDGAVARIAALPGVKEATPIVIATGGVAGEPSMLVFGAERQSFLTRRLVPVAGRLAGPGEAMVGSGAAQTLHWHAGQTVRLYGQPLRLAGIYRSGIPLEDSGVVLPLPLARMLTGRTEGVSMVAISIAQGHREAGVRHEIERALPGTQAIGAPGDLERVDTNSRIIHEAAVIVAILALVLGAVVVLNTMAMAVIERRSELAVMVALGWSRGRISRLLLNESLATSAIGVAAGLGLGVAAAELVVHGLALAVFVAPQLSAWVLVRGLLVGLGLGVLGALFAAWRVMRLPLLESLGRA
jgi:putative ABC transport system permease protein